MTVADDDPVCEREDDEEDPHASTCVISDDSCDAGPTYVAWASFGSLAECVALRSASAVRAAKAALWGRYVKARDCVLV